MTDKDGNGSEPAKGVVFDLDKLAREDGVIVKAALGQDRSNSGVLQRAMTSIVKNEDYRQELKTAFFPSPRKQMQMVLALAECEECGIDTTLVIDLLLAMKAGVNGGLQHDIFEALTHTTFSTNYTGGNKKRWWNKGEDRNGRNSPID